MPGFRHKAAIAYTAVGVFMVQDALNYRNEDGWLDAKLPFYGEYVIYENLT